MTIRESHLPALFSFVINVLIFSLKSRYILFDMQMLEGACQKSRGPENLVRAQGILQFHLLFISALTPGQRGRPRKTWKEENGVNDLDLKWSSKWRRMMRGIWSDRNND